MHTRTSRINKDYFLVLLELAKKQTCDIVIIPRMSKEWVRFGYDNIFGITANSIIAASSFKEHLDSFLDPVWDDISVGYIALYYKDISPFLRLLDKDQKMEFTLDSNIYRVVNSDIGVGQEVDSNQDVPITLPDSSVVTQHNKLTLFPPFDIVKRYFWMEDMWRYSSAVSAQIDLNDDSDFIEIWSGKAADGAKIWKPDINRYGIEFKPYILYLSKTMFTFSKGDKVKVEIRNKLPNRPHNEFLCRFSVYRNIKRKHSEHHYTFLGITMN